jgi:hypothetical protein
MQSIKTELSNLKEILWGLKDLYKTLDVTLNSKEKENLKKVKNERQINSFNNTKKI